MSDLCRLIWCGLIGLFRSRAALEAEILVLRHQLNVLRRKSPKRVTLGSIDRLLLVGLYRLAPGVLDALQIVRPETLMRWHRAGFRAYWRWKSGWPADDAGRHSPSHSRDECRKSALGRAADTRRAPQAWHRRRTDHGGKVYGEEEDAAVAGWKIFLRNHADGIASMDLFLVPTISFRLLYGLLILQHSRRKLLWLGATAYPSAERIARQLTEACGWQQAPRYIIRDRDRVYGGVFVQRPRAMGIRDRPIAPYSPWQNGRGESLIASIRRDCLDHVVVFSEQHLRHLLKSYQNYYNEARTHLSLQKDARSPAPSRPSVRPWPYQ